MNPAIWAVIAAWALATTLFVYTAFKAGYNLGWQERHNDMILPRNIVDRVNRTIEDNDTHHRHSATDPKKAVWH